MFKEEHKKINQLKIKLSRTDYQAIKFAEGLISEEEYTEMKTQRQKWREEINSLYEQLGNSNGEN